MDTKYNPCSVEKKISALWSRKNCFSASIKQKSKAFSIVIPPPNITGVLHMGHALNNTLQDVLIRYKRMCAEAVLWMPGTDHAGIATQNVVERQLAKEKTTKEAIGREAFTQKLWEWKETYGSTILNQLKKLGASCDWKRTRFTMDDAYSDAVKEVFIRLYNKGLIYRGNYIINWCPRCQTALSDEEAAHREINGWLYYIKYPVRKRGGGKEKPDHVIVATTRPETMLGDTAVAVHPDDTRYTWLKEETVLLPLVQRELKVVQDQVVDSEFGTGVVKVTPSHDPVDFTLGKKHNLEFIDIMNSNGTLNENAGEFAGMDRFEAREALIELLNEKKHIIKKEPYLVSAGHCYRCHTIIEPRVSLQWFVKMKPLAREAIRVVKEDKITFRPERWRKVYLNWMDTIRDWCISRQIWWGHRIPVYYCLSCQTDAHASGAGKQKGTIAAKEKPLRCPDCGSKDIRQDKDVLDTWFSSWLWPFATFYWPFTDTDGSNRRAELDYFYPTSVLVTASEILFFWVARMIMAGIEFTGKIPFKDVLIHGTVRDDKGIKMSKSLGNTIDPLDVIEKFGADSLRFSLMLLASTGSDIYLSDEKFLVGRNFANKIWNATRFIISKVPGTEATFNDIVLDELDCADVWILSSLNETISAVSAHLENYRINDATKKCYEFFWHVFCDWYLEIAKITFSPSRAKILLYCLLNAIKLLHPVMPFITEEIYQILRSMIPSCTQELLAVSAWPAPFPITGREHDTDEAALLIGLIKDIRTLKSDLGMPATFRSRARYCCQDHMHKLLSHNKPWVLRLANLETLERVPSLGRTLLTTETFGLDFAVSTVDSERFIASLQKKIVKLERSIQQASGKLRDGQFLTKAPPRTVTMEKERFENSRKEAERLNTLKNAFTR